ncbi:MAG: hypothetical protein ACFFA4_16265 [Promethearchaeota archaeon]
MKIFEWVEEVEKIYENLIENAKKESLDELERLRTEQEKNMEERIENNRKIVESALKSLSENLNNEDNFITEKIKDFKEKMEITYKNYKETLFNTIIKEIGFDF